MPINGILVRLYLQTVNGAEVAAEKRFPIESLSKDIKTGPAQEKCCLIPFEMFGTSVKLTAENKKEKWFMGEGLILKGELILLKDLIPHPVTKQNEKNSEKNIFTDGTDLGGDLPRISEEFISHLKTTGWNVFPEVIARHVLALADR